MTALTTIPAPAPQEVTGILVATVHTVSGSTYAIVIKGEKVVIVRDGDLADGFPQGGTLFEVDSALWLDSQHMLLHWHRAQWGYGHTSPVTKVEVHHPIGHALMAP